MYGLTVSSVSVSFAACFFAIAAVLSFESESPSITRHGRTRRRAVRCTRAEDDQARRAGRRRAPRDGRLRLGRGGPRGAGRAAPQGSGPRRPQALTEPPHVRGGPVARFLALVAGLFLF